ncbi:MAG: phosphohydrolase [Solirubrobacteraceae bacterium]|nr:phosphohydrolase [Solirubrobacteraceae bacterium]
MSSFADPVGSEAELRALFPEPTHNSYRKQIDRLDAYCHELIAATPIVFVATTGPGGSCDVSPRGGPPGWVRAIDEQRLLLPEGRGNNRLDSLVNLIEHPGIGLLFVIPGRNETLRVNGVATITTDPELLATVPLRGRVPPVAIGVQAQEVFTHCGKAFIRSELWDPATWPEREELSSPAEVLRAHTGAGSLEEAQARLDESYTQRLW